MSATIATNSFLQSNTPAGNRFSNHIIFHVHCKNFNQANMVVVTMDFKGGNQRRLQVFKRCLR